MQQWQQKSVYASILDAYSVRSMIYTWALNKIKMHFSQLKPHFPFSSLSIRVWHTTAPLTFYVWNSNEKFSCSPWEPGSLKHIGLPLILFCIQAMNMHYSWLGHHRSHCSLCSHRTPRFNPGPQNLTMKSVLSESKMEIFFLVTETFGNLHIF